MTTHWSSMRGQIENIEINKGIIDYWRTWIPLSFPFDLITISEGVTSIMGCVFFFFLFQTDINQHHKKWQRNRGKSILLGVQIYQQSLLMKKINISNLLATFFSRKMERNSFVMNKQSKTNKKRKEKKRNILHHFWWCCCDWWESIW